MRRTKSPLARDRARQRTLQLIRGATEPGSWVSRKELRSTAKTTGILGVKASSLDRTLDRCVRGLFEARLVDVDNSEMPTSAGLREEIDAAVAMSREEFVGAELVGVEEEAVEAVAANAHERHELFTSAAASGRWEDAKACRPGFRLRQVRLLSGTDPEGSDQ